jgi:hypothetical protein
MTISQKHDRCRWRQIKPVALALSMMALIPVAVAGCGSTGPLRAESLQEAAQIECGSPNWLPITTTGGKGGCEEVYIEDAKIAQKAAKNKEPCTAFSAVKPGETENSIEARTGAFEQKVCEAPHKYEWGDIPPA